MEQRHPIIQFIIALLLILSTGVGCNIIESDPIPTNQVIVEAELGSLTTNLPIIDGKRTGSAYLYKVNIIENNTDWTPQYVNVGQPAVIIIVEPGKQEAYKEGIFKDTVLVLKQDYRRPDTLYFSHYL